MKMKKITKLVLSLLMMLTCINLVNVHAKGNNSSNSKTINAQVVTSSDDISYGVNTFKIRYEDESGNDIALGDRAIKSFSFNENVLNINKATFAQPAGVIDGYVFEDAYFYWSGHYLGTKYSATEFKNFGKKVAGYDSYLGFKCSNKTQKTDKDGYFAYNPTGVLHLVYKQVQPKNPYNIYYFNGEQQYDKVSSASKWDDSSSSYKYYFKATELGNPSYPNPQQGHTYTFIGWNTEEDGTGEWMNDIYESGVTEIHSDIYLYAIYNDSSKKGKAGYNLVVDNASWSNPTPGNLVREGETQKYYYNYGFSKNDKFKVLNNTPVAENYAFIGWMDKKRGKQDAAIRHVGDEVKYIYSDNQTYTLDALWANVSVPDVEVTYDGDAHTVNEIIDINENTGLAEEYKEQARALITTNSTEYSTDNDNWSEEKPEFVDAGEYTVYVRKNVTVGGITTTLTGQGSVIIRPATVTVTIPKQTKTYDGTPLVATGSMSTLVNDEMAILHVSGSITNAGSITPTYTIDWAPTTNTENTISVASDTGEETVTPTAKASNYSVTEAIGDLTITPITSWVEVTITGNTSEIPYDGNEHTLSGFTAKANNPLYITSGDNKYFSYSGTSSITRKDVNRDSEGRVHSYVMGLATSEFSNISSNFTNVTFIIVDGRMTINPKSVTVSAKNSSKAYGAADPDWSQVTADVSGTVGADTVTYSVSRVTGEEIGKYTITPSGAEIQGNYTVSYNTAEFEITKADNMVITPELTGDSATKVYDGKVLTGGATVNITDGTTITYSVNGGEYTTEVPNITEVGKINVTAKAENANYETKTVDYTLEVTPATVKVKADNKTKVYGESDPAFTASVTGKVNEDDVINYTISRTEGENAGNYDILPTGEEIQGNYNVVYENGTLTVTAKSITPDTPDTPEEDKTGIEVSTLDDVKYNGASQQQRPEINDTKTSKTLVEGTDYEVTYSEDTTNAGQVTVTITGIGNYTGEYTVTYNILKRDVTFTSPSASKTYDGSALTSTEIAISGEGFVEGEGASFNVTGTATEVGEVDNTFDYAMNEGTNADNYNVTVVNGKLTITAAPVVPSNDDATPTNNNTTPVTPVTPTRRTTPNRNTTPVAPETDSTPTATPEATVEPTATPEATATPEVIDDDETPEVAPKGNWALINLIAAMLSVLLGVIAILAKHKDEDEDEEDETEDENVSTRHRRWKIVSAIDAIVAVVAFILTEDITQKMVMVDKWTILMVVIAVVGVVSMYFARKWQKEDEETSEDA